MLKALTQSLCKIIEKTILIFLRKLIYCLSANDLNCNQMTIKDYKSLQYFIFL